jgi:hypothetical protein
MTKKIRVKIFLVLILTFQINYAQENIPLQITSGFNADVIANGSGSALASTSFGVDVVNFCFMAANFQPTAAAPPAYALPINGQITNSANPSIGFQMGNYSGNNSLRLVTVNNTGTLSFSSPTTASKLYVLVTSGSGQSVVSANILFSDNTTQMITNNTAPDWFNSNALPIVTSGIGRVNRTTNGIENPFGNPRLYQLTLNILAANQSKLITGVQFTKTSTAEGVFNAFAITAETIPTCPQPFNVSATTTANSATVSWNVPSIIPTSGYDYYFSSLATPPNATTAPTGNVTSAQTNVSFSNLITGATYNCWVRSRCNATTFSNWVLVSFTTGQLEFTYTVGDLPSLYNTAVTLTSTTTCPGTLSVTVPEGYEIAATATSYQVTAANSAYQSEQRSLLYCTTTNIGETAISNGPAISTFGTATYNRTNLSLANGATGVVTFELRSWRTWGGSGCDTTYNKVDNNTWKITITYVATGCETPAAPTAASQTFCGNTILDAISVNSLPNAAITWYANETTENALAENTEVTTGTYYVTQSFGTCESERAAVMVTINPATALPNATEQVFCGSATVSDLTVSGGIGASFLWYENSNDETPITNLTEIQSGTYYVTQTLDACESEKLAVDVIVNETPEVPIVTDFEFCGAVNINAIDLTDENFGTILWYENNTDTIALEPTAQLITGVYYVSQSVEGCESDKVPVNITILTIPETPIATGQSFCGEATTADLVVSGEVAGTILWYESDDAVIALEPDEALVSGTYFVSQILEGCESERATVSINIFAQPDLPIAEDQIFCGNETVSALLVSDETTGDITWFENSDDTIGLDPTAALISGVYYVSQTIEGCTSERLAVTITVNEITATPTYAGGNIFNEGTILADIPVLFLESVVVQWYILDENNTFVPVDISTMVTTTTYYVSQSLNNCESAYLTITVDTVLSNDLFESELLSVYPNPASNILYISTKNNIESLRIMNLLGQVILINKNPIEGQIAVNTLENGAYLLEVKEANKPIKVVRFIKN